jgi:hypothetical protein
VSAIFFLVSYISYDQFTLVMGMANRWRAKAAIDLLCFVVNKKGIGEKLSRKNNGSVVIC